MTSYRIKNLADAVGMTSEGIRYLERRGIVASIRNEQNGYRYFDQSQLVTLKHIRMYTGMGFSLEEACGLVRGMVLSDIRQTMEDRLKGLDEEIRRLQSARDDLARELASVNFADAYQECNMVWHEEMLFFPRRCEEKVINEHFLHDASISSRIRETRFMMTTNRAHDGADAGFVLRASKWRGDALPEGVVRIPAAMCVHGIVRRAPCDLPDCGPLFTWADEHGLLLEGVAYCIHLLQTLGANGEKCILHECFLPVAKAPGM